MLRVPEEREILDMQCRSCGNHHVRLVIDLGDQPLCNRLVKPGADNPPSYPLRLGYCEDCTLLQIDATIPRDDMFKDYVYVSGTTDTLRRHFAETTDRLSAYLSDPGQLVVDIGSNDGTWLEQWKGKCRRIGVDPAEKQALMAMDKGIDTHIAYFDLETARHLRRVHGPAQIITSAGSFFHMEDLHGAVEGVKHLLADDGVFVCQAISGNDMISGNAFDQVLHEHLCYYTPNSFASLMDRHDLELAKWIHHPIHGGTFEYHVVKKTGKWDPVPLPHVNFYDCEQFARRVLNIQRDLLSVLREYAARDKVVVAYGAPGKGGTLLNSFGIGTDLVPWAVEKNPLKFGLEIPGCRIPIKDEREQTAPIDALLVLAWNFLDEFLVKERDYLKSGGEFIVPVPEVRVITGDDIP